MTNAPYTITFNGQQYERTGKTGTHLRTGQAATEYSCHYQRHGLDYEIRAWLLADGTIENA